MGYISVYKLYFNKKEKVLQISPNGEKIENGKFDKNVVLSDKTHYASTSKDALKRKAVELKKDWVEDCKKELKLFSDIKINS